MMIQTGRTGHTWINKNGFHFNEGGRFLTFGIIKMREKAYLLHFFIYIPILKIIYRANIYFGRNSTTKNHCGWIYP